VNKDTVDGVDIFLQSVNLTMPGIIKALARCSFIAYMLFLAWPASVMGTQMDFESMSIVVEYLPDKGQYAQLLNIA
jgi:hypothetical protein